MRELNRMVSMEAPPDALLTLPYNKRQRSLLRAFLDNGEEIGVRLQHGTVLRDGDQLGSDDGFVVTVKSALETVSTVHGKDALELTRVAYHLGNRHVALQIGNGWIRYLHDHVLDDMVRRFGLNVTVGQAAFEPEAGAYHKHNH